MYREGRRGSERNRLIDMPNQLVTIETFQTLPEAEAARMYLADQGIEAHLSDAEAVNMTALLGNALGSIKLQVLSDQVDDAALWLEQGRSGYGKWADDDQDTAGDRCLACDEPLPVGKSKCRSCGWTYGKAMHGALDDDESATGIEDEDEGYYTDAMDALRELKWPVIVTGIVLVLLLLSLIVIFLEGLFG
jgi:hypothetical protein